LFYVGGLGQGLRQLWGAYPPQVHGAPLFMQTLDMTVCLNLPSLTHDALAYGYCKNARRHCACVCNRSFKINGLSEARESPGNGGLRGMCFLQIKNG
jgi:hypothetical protein